MRAEEVLKKMLTQIKELIIEEKLKTVIDCKYTFDQVSEAHAYADSEKKENVVLIINH